MKRFCLAALTAMTAASAAPAIAQEQSFLAYDRSGFSNYDPSTSFAARFADYRQLVAKKTRDDGGTLSAEDKIMLHHRLRQLVAERAVRRHPTWSGKVS